MSDLCTIRAAELSLEDVLQLACNHVLAKRRQAVDKHGALQVVELVLHHTCLVTFHPLVVLLHLLVDCTSFLLYSVCPSIYYVISYTIVYI